MELDLDFEYEIKNLALTSHGFPYPIRKGPNIQKLQKAS